MGENLIEKFDDELEVLHSKLNWTGNVNEIIAAARRYTPNLLREVGSEIGVIALFAEYVQQQRR